MRAWRRPRPQPVEAAVPARRLRLSAGRRLRSRLLLFAAGFLFILLALPLARGQVELADDLGDFHFPLRVFYARCLALGDSFLWSPDLYCGFDLHGEGQVGLYHPLHLLLYTALPVTVAFEIEILAGYPALFAGTFLCLRRIRLPRDAALLGAFVFTFSGFNLYHFKHPNLIGVVAHLPWLLLAADALMQSESPRRLAWSRLGVAVLTASQLLLGHPQGVFFSCVVEAAYVVALARGQEGRWRRVRNWALAKLLGGLAGSVQLLPTWDALRHSIRVRPSRQFVAMGSLHPANLFQFLAPYLYVPRIFGPGFRLPDHAGLMDAALSFSDWRSHEFGNYCGSAVPPLLIWLCLRRDRLGRHRAAVRWAVALGVAALVLALGKYTPLLEVTWRLPLVRMFRVPARYLLLVHLATAVLAAVAVADLGRMRNPSSPFPPRRLWPLGVIPVMSVAVSLAVPLAAERWPAAFLAGAVGPWPAQAAGPVLASVAAALVALAALGLRWALAALMVFVVADQGFFSLSYVSSYPRGTLARAAELEPLPPAAGARPHIQFSDPRRDSLTLQGARLITGYSGLIPARRLDYTRTASLRVAGAEWVGDRQPDHSMRWTAVPDPMPRARLVSKLVSSARPARDLESIDLRTTALVERAIEGLADGPGKATILADRPGRIGVSTESDTSQLLVLTERFHEGWRATVDGRPCTPVRVNGDFLGCPVGQGQHAVRFTFEPDSFRLGAALTAIACAGMILWLGAGLLTARRIEQTA